MADWAAWLLEEGLPAPGDGDLHAAAGIALNGRELERLSRGSLRRLATYLMEGPRNVRWVIDCTLGIEAMGRIGDHACGIARNIVYAVTGEDLRHASITNPGAD